MGRKCDFSGWATKNDLQCTDGRVIRRNAFKDNHGRKVPLVWNHQHNSPDNVLGHAVLENREEGVYAYCFLNESSAAMQTKEVLRHGDIECLSIWANELVQRGADVLHGVIKEVSVVLAGANPGAYVDAVLSHSDDSIESATIYTGEPIDDTEYEVEIKHSDEKKESEKKDDADDKDDKGDEKDEETVQEVLDSMTEKQRNVLFAIVGQALEDGKSEDDDDNNPDKKKDMKHSEEDSDMKKNIFDREDNREEDVLSHADQAQIIGMAKSNSVGSLQTAIGIFAENNEELMHGIDKIENLFPEFKDVKPGAPELIERDQGWVGVVMDKIHKSPISRIRTRQADIRGNGIRARGYKKGKKKEEMGNLTLISRTTDPQTVYIKDHLDRDDIIDIEDFDVVQYMYGIMRQTLREELALAAMVGDGRELGDESKIREEHIRPIWKDDELYTIHAEVDIDAAKKELQGTSTGAHFGENYIYAEAIINAALYSRETFKGSGTPDFFCTPHLLNVMLLARDLNGRRIYSSKTDLAAALNVKEIYTAEQFEGLTRTGADGKQKKLLGIFVNLDDYRFGAAKKGEITSFNQFDIDFNQEKYLIETRLSGALTRIKSAIVLEIDPAKDTNGITIGDGVVDGGTYGEEAAQ